MKCRSIQKNINKVCVGDFNKRIKIQTSSIKANNSPSAVSEVAFQTLANVWALIKTAPNREFIDGVNIENGLNTDFYVRYSPSINYEEQLWIEYDNNRFKIKNIENIDAENKIIRIRCIEKGDKSILANAR